MAIIIWLIMGGLAGWVASIIVGTNKTQGLLGNIIVGVLGAVVGGWLMATFGQNSADLTTFNWYSFFVATGGAVVLLFIYRLLTKKN